MTDPDGDAFVGTNDAAARTPVDAEFDGDKAVAADGWTTLQFADVIARTDEITELAVPFSDDPNDGALRTPDGSSAYQYVSTLEYDEAAGTMTDVTTGTVYSDIGTGAFTSDDGEELLPGWQITVGFDNFVRAVTDPRLAQPLIYVTLWTFAFALISVASTFFLGLFLAIVFNDMRMRGRKYYRVLMILPYAIPSFLSALIWAGMMNESFGFINQVLLGGRRDPMAHGSMAGQGLGAAREPLARLPLHVPRVHGRAAVDPRRAAGGRDRRRREALGGVPADQAAAAARHGGAAADRLVRVQLQQLQH